MRPGTSLFRELRYLRSRSAVFPTPMRRARKSEFGLALNDKKRSRAVQDGLSKISVAVPDPLLETLGYGNGPIVAEPRGVPPKMVPLMNFGATLGKRVEHGEDRRLHRLAPEPPPREAEPGIVDLFAPTPILLRSERRIVVELFDMLVPTIFVA